MKRATQFIFTVVSLLLCVPTTLKAATDRDSVRREVNKVKISIPVLIPLPEQVYTTRNATMSLNGKWLFSSDTNNTTNLKTINVPGEWVMQGFTVEQGNKAYYRKTFTLPADWKGKHVFVRFDGISSHALIKLNGKLVGEHEGSFVPFNFDLSDKVIAGTNLLEAEVQAETISDKLACTSQYAAHTVGGILRKVTLFALPNTYLSDFNWSVKFDKDYNDASLRIRCQLTNNSLNSSQTRLQVTLTDKNGKTATINKTDFPVTFQQGMAVLDCPIEVKTPLKWDPEHPNLYTLTVKILTNNTLQQVYKQKIGFRQIEIRGNRLFVNNHPIKLRGVCRHESHPLLGRSLTPELCRKDVELFRDGNCNYIRTSHYPPSEEFLQACDELGMFVESEASLCWIQHGSSPIWKTWNYMDTKYLPYLLRANFENILAGRNHPSVFMWSLANESRWSPLFERVNDEVKKFDPSRPTAFHDQCWGGYNNAGSKADVANYHYPGFNGPRECEKDLKRTTVFGEYMHVQCYARRELETDPGVRSDVWANTLKQMVDSVYAYPAALGGAIWSGIDDIFHISKTKIRGYGPWGIIDSWRRPKPEYTGMKNSYAPVIIRNLRNAVIENNTLKLELENRFNFTDLKELRITAQTGTKVLVLKTSLAPLHRREARFNLPGIKPNDEVKLTFYDPRGFVCQEVKINAAIPKTDKEQVIVKPALTENNNSFTINMGKHRFVVDKKTGTLDAFDAKGKKIFGRSLCFMLVPMNRDDGGAKGIAGNNYTESIKPLEYQPDPNFKTENVSAVNSKDGAVTVRITGSVRDTCKGDIEIRFTQADKLQISYQFVTLADFTKNNLIRQYGIWFQLSNAYNQLQWHRKGLWTVYPDYDINRLKGSVIGYPLKIKYTATPRMIPSGMWKDDANAQGSNDFRSTKDHIYRVALLNTLKKGIEVVSDGSQSARAWLSGENVNLLIAGVNGPGSCYFFTGPRLHFAKGSILKGSFSMKLL